jgi:signal transduction histidine kinase
MTNNVAQWIERVAPVPLEPGLELATESISVKIRWFGLAVGGLIANFAQEQGNPLALNIILALGLAYTSWNTWFFLQGRLFLGNHALLVSGMEATFIGLLCAFDTGLLSPFRFYYLLSLICCAIRFSPRITFLTCGFDCISYTGILCLVGPDRQNVLVYFLTIIILIWVAWAAGAMARLLKEASGELRTLNQELRASSALLEHRIAERTRELEESQAQVLHQEKMAAFGLLAAGIAHEVGNPLTSISSIVQILEHRDPDSYTKGKLELVTGQLARIQTILRELILFSRPTNTERGRVVLAEVVREALSIAKFYKGGKNRNITTDLPDGLPSLMGVHDQIVQVLFNLILNAIDATGKGGHITLRAQATTDTVEIQVIDDGHGIPAEVQEKLFRPYFTTKRQGTGLGLFVIRRILNAHGGSIRCESTLGQGTTFHITLPRESESQG